MVRFFQNPFADISTMPMQGLVIGIILVILIGTILGILIFFRGHEFEQKSRKFLRIISRRPICHLSAADGSYVFFGVLIIMLLFCCGGSFSSLISKSQLYTSEYIKRGNDNKFWLFGLGFWAHGIANLCLTIFATITFLVFIYVYSHKLKRSLATRAIWLLHKIRRKHVQPSVYPQGRLWLLGVGIVCLPIPGIYLFIHYHVYPQSEFTVSWYYFAVVGFLTLLFLCYVIGVCGTDFKFYSLRIQRWCRCGCKILKYLAVLYSIYNQI